MALASQTKHRVIENTSVPYKSYTDITNNEANFVAGQNILSTSKQLMERRPGFSAAMESTPTAFTALAREFKWSKFNGTSFYSMVNDISGGTSKVYKKLIGTDANYVLLFTSATTNAFSFEASSNVLYFGNQLDMRAWNGTGNSYTWGITRPPGPVSVSTTGTGISAFAGGWFYRATYWDSVAGHESSSSDLSPCTGNVANKTIQIPLVASSNSRVTGIRVYRTTDGGSTDPSLMQEITGSPFANSTATVNDTTADASLSTRTAPGTASNDPPPLSFGLAVYGGRIWTADGGTVYFSGNEEISNGVAEECFPSGLDGNNYPWPRLVKALAPMPDGIAVFQGGQIGKIEGDRRDNFRRYTLMQKRGSVSLTSVCSLGGTDAWLDTSSQVWLDGEEIGFDIRTDLIGIDHSKAYMTIHISGRFHWLMLLDGGRGKIFVYDLDTKQWMVPWVVATGSTCLNSGEESDGNVVLSIAWAGTKMLKMNTASYNDNGTAYAASGTLNLLHTHPEGNAELNGSLDSVAIETDSHLNSAVSVLIDDDPATGTYQTITGNITDPPKRRQGVNLLKKIYTCGVDDDQGTQVPQGERASVKLDWAAVNSNFLCYTIDLAWKLAGQ